ncbi:MAG: hypothetical protein ACKO7Q_09785 [Actinomycetota bacterium]
MDTGIEKVVVRRSLHEPDRSDAEYWAARTMEERISHVTDLRSEAYGYDDATESRLQRVCRRVR